MGFPTHPCSRVLISSFNRLLSIGTVCRIEFPDQGRTSCEPFHLRSAEPRTDRAPNRIQQRSDGSWDFLHEVDVFRIPRGGLEYQFIEGCAPSKRALPGDRLLTESDPPKAEGEIKDLSQEQWIGILSDPDLNDEYLFDVFQYLLRQPEYKGFGSGIGLELGHGGKATQSPVYSGIGLFGKKLASRSHP